MTDYSQKYRQTISALFIELADALGCDPTLKKRVILAKAIARLREQVENTIHQNRVLKYALDVIHSQGQQIQRLSRQLAESQVPFKG